MLLVRLAFTAIVMVVVIWLLSTGKPFGGLVLVPLVAIWLRRAAESGRLSRVVLRLPKP
jgi:hypothetical protein